MTDWTAREIAVPLAFLGPGEYQAEIFQDGADADINPTHVKIVRKIVTAKSSLPVRLAKGGGLAVRFRKE